MDVRNILDFFAGTAALDLASGVQCWQAEEAFDALFGYRAILPKENSDMNNNMSGVPGSFFHSCAILCFSGLYTDNIV